LIYKYIQQNNIDINILNNDKIFQTNGNHSNKDKKSLVVNLFSDIDDSFNCTLTHKDYFKVVFNLMRGYGDLYEMRKRLYSSEIILLVDMNFDDIYLPLLLNIMLRQDFKQEPQIFSINTKPLSNERAYFYMNQFKISFLDISIESFFDEIVKRTNK
jgi:hypothetical protein